MLGALNVSVKMDLESKDLRPGDVLSGVVHVSVRETVSITAVRVHVTGIESGFVRVTLGTSVKTMPFLHTHFDSLITLFGYSKTSGRRGGVTLSKGAYEYPFRCALPPNVPPSYRCTIDMASGSLSYEVKAYVDIPNSYNAKKEEAFVVWPTAPLWQVQLAHTQRYVVPTINTTAYSKGGLCCRGKSKPIQVVIEATPTVLVAGGGGGVVNGSRKSVGDSEGNNYNNNNGSSGGSSGGGGGGAVAVADAAACAPAGESTACSAPDCYNSNDGTDNNNNNNNNNNATYAVNPSAPVPLSYTTPLPGMTPAPLNVLTVYVTLHNITSTRIGSVSVKLAWRALFTMLGFVVDDEKTICKRTLPVPMHSLQQDGSVTLRFDLPLDDALRVDTRVSNKYACAPLKTSSVEVFTVLRVFVSDVAMDEEVVKGVVQLTSCVDETNRALAIPVHYTEKHLLPENIDLAS